MSKPKKLSETQTVRYVELTPFNIVTEKDKGCYIVIGNEIAELTIYKTEEEAKKRIEQTDWQLIGATIFNYMKNIEITKNKIKI
jgi:hypothetical protein